MIDLEFLKTSGFFREVYLKKGDILFHEGDEDRNLYIIYDGELDVQKSIKSKKGHFKSLSFLRVGNILGEGGLTRSDKKEVQIQATRDSLLLAIDGEKSFQQFMIQHPDTAYELLIHIISYSNNRLLRSNQEITANYEVSQAISHIEGFDMDTLYKLLDNFQTILEVDQILYFEKNVVLDDYYKLRYNSMSLHKIQNVIFKFSKEKISLSELKKQKIELCDYLLEVPLLLGNENHGFLLIGRKHRDFYENEEKLLQNTAISFTGVIRQKEILDAEKNKLYIKNG